MAADVLDFCAFKARKARRDGGGAVTAGDETPRTVADRAPLDAETRRALRRWRCFEARLSALDAAKRACVTVRAWGDAERGRPVPDAVRWRILNVWAQSESV